MTQDRAHLTQMLRKPLELNAKAGDRILVMTDGRMDPLLWQALQAAAHELGMEPIVTIMDARATHSTNPPESIRRAALSDDIDLCIYLTSTAMAHASLTEEFIVNGKRFILMEELTPAMLAPDGPASADYFALNELGLKIAAVFSQGSEIQVVCPNGTDLRAEIRGRVGRSIAGIPIIMRPGGGGGCAFPDGEAHVCPVEGTGEGYVVFDVTAHNVGLIKEPMRLTVRKGLVVDIEGGREADVWKDLLKQFEDPNNYNCPAEIAIGLNPKVVPTGSMRTDKKMYGSSHIGIGDTMALGGTCHARLRLEGVIRHPEIRVDGQVLTQGGRILLDDGSVWNTRLARPTSQ
jgi:2,5-dihydroxypyridine 5,6-dioxygenase